jgi:transaldolase
MQIFIDSANVVEIQKWIDCGIADGATTNPSIMLKDGAKSIKERVEEILEVLKGKPLSVEVVTEDPETMIQQAEELSNLSSNIVVKIPVISSKGKPNLGIINSLSKDFIKVNATACFSLGQVILSVKAGATYASIFAGRVADEGGDPWWLVSKSVEWLDRWDCNCQLLVGSIRSVIDIQNAALSGAHIITIPPGFLDKWVDHKYSRFTVKQFMEDATK